MVYVPYFHGSKTLLYLIIAQGRDVRNRFIHKFGSLAPFVNGLFSGLCRALALQASFCDSLRVFASKAYIRYALLSS